MGTGKHYYSKEFKLKAIELSNVRGNAREIAESRHCYPIVTNRLKRNFFTTRKSQVWVSDITYVKTTNGWLYVTVILDLYDRKIVGCSLNNNLSAKNTTIAAWNMAIRNRPLTQKFIFHSDRGIQYACGEFSKLLESNPMAIIRSMSGKGMCVVTNHIGKFVYNLQLINSNG